MAQMKKAKSVTLKAVASSSENARHSSDAGVSTGTEAVKEFLASGADEAKKAQEKFLGIGRESAEHFSRSADATARSLNEAVSLSRENVEAAVECGNAAADIVRSMSTELLAYANSAFSENVETSKRVFGCRTINDWFDLQNDLFRTNVDLVINQTLKLSELSFKLAMDTAEPMNERLTVATNKLAQTFASAQAE